MVRVRSSREVLMGSASVSVAELTCGIARDSRGQRV